MYSDRSGLTTKSTLNTGALRGMEGNRRRFGFQLAVLAAVTFLLSGAEGFAWAAVAAKPEDKAVATGDHWKITESELDQQAKPQIELLENMMKQARARTLNAMIDRRVLDEAAKAEKLTPDELLKHEVDSKVPLPSDAEAKAFYDQHK
ncbi:MAG: SurA N-terminal domain-containing protein, partial [Candidatus Binatus sp.]